VILKFAPTHFKFQLKTFVTEKYSSTVMQTQLHSLPNIPNTISWYTYRARLWQLDNYQATIAFVLVFNFQGMYFHCYCCGC